MKKESKRVKEWREKNKKLCSDCGEEWILPESKICTKCACARRSEFSKETTIGEVRKSLAVKNKHPSWLHARVRTLCRSWLSKLTTEGCKNCGYDKFVELCHIKPISKFSDTATLGEVNSELNVVPLCRNCHWETHNGFLNIEDFRAP
jgi:5-methylcytosine-specific restriction endonuclease McrA